MVYRRGDSLGGIYGLVSGVVTINTAPKTDTPRLVHLGEPGTWTGEGCFLSRHPRRLDLQARSQVCLMHLPLDAMDTMAQSDPAAIRNFAQILMATVEVLVRIVHDLQISSVDRRIASVLHRMAWAGDQPIPLSQSEVGDMANASRKQINAVLGKFAAMGWIERSYRSISIRDVKALESFAAGRAGDA